LIENLYEKLIVQKEITFAENKYMYPNINVETRLNTINEKNNIQDLDINLKWMPKNAKQII